MQCKAKSFAVIVDMSISVNMLYSSTSHYAIAKQRIFIQSKDYSCCVNMFKSHYTMQSKEAPYKAWSLSVNMLCSRAC